MLVENVPKVHAVKLIPGQDENVVVVASRKVVNVLADGVCGALIPIVALLRLLGRENVDGAPAKRVETIGFLDVPMQRCRVELRQQVNPVDLRVEAIADRDVHQSVLTRKRHGRLAPLLGERMESRAAASPHDYSNYFFFRHLGNSQFGPYRW